MASSLVSVITDLHTKIGELSALVSGLREEIRVLTEEKTTLERDLAAMKAERDRLTVDAEYLTVSHRLAESPDSIIEARRMIGGMIRNIDRCIEMLKE